MSVMGYFGYGVAVAFVLSVLCWLWCALSCGRAADDAADRLERSLRETPEQDG